MAGALSIGLFCAMLPVPFQMLLAALASMRARVNIPVSMAACWVTNPFTHPPLIALQINFGHMIREHIHIPLPFDKTTEISFLGVDVIGSPADFVVGFLATGVVLSILAYPIVYSVSMFFPNRGKRLASEQRSEQKPSR